MAELISYTHNPYEAKLPDGRYYGIVKEVNRVQTANLRGTAYVAMYIHMDHDHSNKVIRYDHQAHDVRAIEQPLLYVGYIASSQEDWEAFKSSLPRDAHVDIVRERIIAIRFFPLSHAQMFHV